MRLLLAGASGGIGGALSRVARAAGHEVVEVGRAEFADPRLMERLDGFFDAVVFAVGTCPVKPLTLCSDEELTGTFTVNCVYFARLMRHLLSRRLYSPQGMKALAVSSVSAVEGWAGGSAYCASKGALSALCRALDAELSPRGISVEAIEPRYVKTRMFDSCAGRMGVSPDLAQAPEDLASEILAKLER
jgi:short-subunit dehydrogenase